MSGLSGPPEHTDRPSSETAHESDGNTCVVSSIDDIASRCPTTGNRDEQKNNYSLGGTWVSAAMRFDGDLQEKETDGCCRRKKNVGINTFTKFNGVFFQYLN
ncbi:hypothetical protein [Pseudomonas azerbaijanoccidentalis]